MQDPYHIRHRVIQTEMDGGHNPHPLLDQCQRCADWHLRVVFGHLVERGMYRATSRLDYETEQLEQRLGRPVVWQRHQQLAYVLRAGNRTFHLDDLRRIQFLRLSDEVCSLES